METREYSSDIDKWAHENIGQITQALEQIREDNYSSRVTLEEFDDAEQFDLTNRLLSEMEICRSNDLIPLPKGFSVKNSLVSWVNEGAEPEKHIFLVDNDNKEIICITSGQFVAPYDKSFQPGQRISQLQEKAPDLVRKYSDQVYILYGKAEDIEIRLGLKYQI